MKKRKVKTKCPLGHTFKTYTIIENQRVRQTDYNKI